MTIFGFRSFHSRSLVFVGVCLLPGCAGGGPDLAKVTGTVTRGGKPVPNLLVHFVPDNGRPSWGLTDSNGRYKLYYTQEEDGARFGQHRVYVQLNQAQPQSFAGTGSAHVEKGPDLHETVDEEATTPPKSVKTELSPEELSSVIEKYGNLEKSALSVTITKSGQVIDLKLD